jgi:hypothetical protein
MKKFKVSHSRLAAPLALLALATSAGVLCAQPDPNDMPKGDNPPTRPDGPRGGNKGERPDFRNMTPEQRQQFEQKREEENVRRALKRAGYTDAKVQDAVVAFAAEQNKDESASKDKVRELSKAVRDGASDSEIATLLTAVRADSQAAQAQRQAALKELDAKISYTKSAKLEATLVLLGLTGENISDGPGMRGGPGGRGMNGNRPGGGPNGRQPNNGAPRNDGPNRPAAGGDNENRDNPPPPND